MSELVVRTVSLLGLAIFVALVARRLRLPYTVGLVMAGGALTGFRVATGLELTHDLIFDVVLPPLLFEAALNLRWKELERELVPVLALSTVGVVLSAASVAWGLVQFLAWPMVSALAFGALIAATDPISVIALLRQSGVGGRLRLLIEFESLFNDGAATVLFTLVLFWAAHSERGVGALEAAKIFAETAGGGLVTGTVVGLAAVLVAGTSDDHLVETALSVLAAFGSFVLAESFHGSGVLATVTAGVVMGNLGVVAPKRGLRLALSARGRTFVLEFWEFAAFLANSLVFLLIGSATATVDFSREGWQALAIAIGLTLGARAVAVFPICLSLWPSRWRISFNEQLLLWWGGLRGALALALALSLPPDMPLRSDILIVAFAVVAFSVIVQGLTAPYALVWLRLVKGGRQ